MPWRGAATGSRISLRHPCRCRSSPTILRGHVAHDRKRELARLGVAGELDDGLIETNCKKFVQAVAAFARRACDAER